VHIPPADQYTPLERGLVDGFPGNWEEAVAFKKFEVTEYRTAINGWTRGMSQIMNLDVWNGLPPDIQQIFEETTGLGRSELAAHIFAEADGQCRQMIEDYDKQAGNPAIYDLPKEERDKWAAVVDGVAEEWAEEMDAKGLPGTAMLAEARDMVATLEK
jgi:TRAP-type C4-dicarboxylate transport system substrate-binding protein